MVIPSKDPKSPDTTSFAWDAMIEKWDMIETLLGGTEAMRAAGSVYLPQHDEESNDNYNERLLTNVLTNKLEQTLDNFVGRPFSDPVRLNDDVPENIEELTNNIDLQGNNLTVFCRTWFREGLAKGFSHCLVDFPRMNDEEKGSRTLADDMAEGRRPYWVMIKPENLIFAAADIVETDNGVQEFLTHVRIKEIIIEQDGFTEVAHEQIRVLEPGFFQLWRKVQQKGKRKPEWRIIDSGETGLDFVPLVTFYSAERKGLMITKPPLEDLAHMNIRHWQSNSDQINVLTVARFPMLAVAGATDSSGTVMRIGPRQLLGTKDPNGRFYYVEHTGKSIEAGRTDLQDLEDQMGTYGAAFLKRKSGDQTATARALDSAESVSPLQDMTIRFIDSVNNALSITAAWLGQDEGGTVVITTDFGPEELNDTDANTLSRARDKREISRFAFIEELKRRGIIDEEYDTEGDMALIKQEIRDNEDLLPFQVPPGVFDPSEEGGIGTPKKEGAESSNPET